MTDARWNAMIATEWNAIMQRARAAARRKRETERLERFRRALDYIRTQGDGA